MSEFTETTVRVRYAETDQMGVVYHANYLVWFEVGRVEMLRQLGFSYRNMEKQDDTHIAVVDVRCRYKAPARYDDLLTLETRVLNHRTSMIRFGYRLLRPVPDSDPVLLAEGETVHVVVDRAMQKRPLPERFAIALRTMGGTHAQEAVSS